MDVKFIFCLSGENNKYDFSSIFLAISCSLSVLICSSCHQGEKTKDSKSGADSNISVQNLSSQLDVAEEAQVQLSQVQLRYQEPNLINLRCFAELPTAGLNLNHRFKVKSGRIWIADSNLSQPTVGSSKSLNSVSGVLRWKQIKSNINSQKVFKLSFISSS